ncbi:type 4b pilus protein PilO2 [Herbaspirillum sp. AP02]|nr:type 4b pilus protein PilO2 [Herbaspirillum sp. AP02]NZD70116.1 type 4b pilus protein PilO2 [Herbaspirillum sp. AP21]
MPGFDVIGSADVVAERLNTFLQLADGSTVRRLGAVDLLGNVEEIDWELVLDEVDAKVRLKKIPDIKQILTVLAVSAVLFVAVFGAITYKLARDKRIADEQARIANDPNIVYEKKIDGDLAAVTGTGQTSLQRMVGGLKQIPLQIKGWRLSKVECTPTLCNASWTRSYGNFAEFGRALPPSAMGQPQYDVFKPEDLTSARLVTQHRPGALGHAVPAVRGQLVAGLWAGPLPAAELPRCHHAVDGTGGTGVLPQRRAGGQGAPPGARGSTLNAPARQRRAGRRAGGRPVRQPGAGGRSVL